MARVEDFVPRGVIPAVLLPFDADFAIDEAAYRSHLRDVVAVEGVSAITTNCHSTEVHACSFEEQKRVLDITMDEAGDRVPVVAGVCADGSLEAARIARMAAEGGASALLVFPPWTLAFGGYLRPEMAVAHFQAVAEAADLPLICFLYPAWTNVHYPPDTLLRLFEEVPRIRAVKDMCGDPKQHEENIRRFHALDRPVNVLSTHSAWLYASLMLGCRGLLSGAGSVIADLQAELFAAVEAQDMARARAVNDRIFPATQAFYAPPLADMHNRMKEALVLLGRQRQAVVRPPLVKLPESEIERLRAALEAAGLLGQGNTRVAAE